MVYAVLADLVMAVHAAFVMAAVLGGLLALRWPATAWVHGPILLWAVGVELFGWPCPLTALEHDLGRAAGGVGYTGGFLAHYLSAVLYPPGLTRAHQVGLGALLAVFNAGIYALVWRRHRRKAV